MTLDELARTVLRDWKLRPEDGQALPHEWQKVIDVAVAMFRNSLSRAHAQMKEDGRG